MFNKSRVGIHAAVVAGSVLVCGVLPEASADVGVRLRASESPNSPYGETVELYSKSYALVIGIDDYTDGWPRLSNAVKDARAVADALTKRGFDVTLGLNLNSRDMKEAFERFFILRGQDPDARLFTWYAGHGETIAGQGFLVPADAPLSDATAEFKLKALPMRRFSEYMRLAVAMHVLAVFDSCFSGTVFENQRGKPPAAITAATARPVRQFLSSGDAGQQVSDDGRFRELFLRGIAGEEGADANADGYVTATELGFYITDRVTNLTEGSQTPRYGKLRDQDYDRGDFVFMAAATPARADTTAAPAPPKEQAPTVFDERQLELAFWQSIQDSGNPADFEAYLESYPRGTYAGLARNRLRVLGDAQRGASAPRTTAFEIIEMEAPYVVTQVANLREGPSTEYAKLGKFATGTEITVTGKVQDTDWFRVARAGEPAAFIYGALIEDAMAPAPAPKIDPQAVLWDSIEDSKNPADFEAYLKQFPKGLFSDLARNRLAIANKEMLSAARNPASGAGPRLVYNIPPVQTMQGERVDVVTNIIRGTLGALPGASIVQEPVESDAYDVLVTAMISRLNRRMVPNPSLVGRTILSAIGGVAGLGAIGNIVPQGPPQLAEYDVEIVLDAWNRRTNSYVSESGLAKIQVDPGQILDRQGINTALQMAANEAARRLVVRLSGGVPEPRPTARERSSPGATQGHTPQGSR